MRLHMGGPQGSYVGDPNPAVGGLPCQSHHMPGGAKAAQIQGERLDSASWWGAARFWKSTGAWKCCCGRFWKT